MSLNDIVFEKAQGGLGKPLAGEDHICGLLTYSATLPSGFAANGAKKYEALSQAEADGITEGDADWGVIWYFISEFFRMNPKGVVWVYIADVPAGAYDFTELQALQVAADGSIRKGGVYMTSTAYATTQVTALQAVYDSLFADHMPMQIIYAPDISGTADISTIADLRTLTAPNVSVLIGQDGGNAGAALFGDVGKSVPCLGALLGALSLAKVNECIAWVGKFPLQGSDTELSVAAFSNGQLVKDLATNVVSGVNTKGYIFLRKFVGDPGTYFNDSHTAVAANNDYSSIEANVTIDKAIRQVRLKLLPQLNAPVLVDATTGQLSNDYVEFLKAKGDEALAQMERDWELSGYQTIIDPTQNVLATGNVAISIQNVPVGVSRNFSIKIGYVKQLS